MGFLVGRCAVLTIFAVSMGGAAEPEEERGGCVAGAGDFF